MRPSKVRQGEAIANIGHRFGRGLRPLHPRKVAPMLEGVRMSGWCDARRLGLLGCEDVRIVGRARGRSSCMATQAPVTRPATVLALKTSRFCFGRPRIRLMSPYTPRFGAAA